MRGASTIAGSQKRRRRWLAVTVALVFLIDAATIAGASYTSAVSGAGAVSTATLAAPSGLAATETASVNVSWTATTSAYATGTRVFRATVSGGPYSQIAQIAGLATTTYSDNPPVGTYFYVVRSFYENWESVNSNQVTATLRLVVTGVYTGNGVDNRSITGVGFQPDVVMVKCTCGQASVIRTSTMAGDATKEIGLLNALQPDHVQALDADGFTIGASARVNTSGNTYHWTAMRAGVNLRVGSYVGDGTDNRLITGVGFQPVWVVTLGGGEESLVRPGTVSGDNSYRVDGASPLADRIQQLLADGFAVGANSNANKSAITFHYIAWKADSNVKQGTYLGSGADDRSITGVGFQPLMIWVKREDGVQAVWRPKSIAGDLSLFWASTVSSSDRIQILEADGFQVGTTTQVNALNQTYHYLALRDGGP